MKTVQSLAWRQLVTEAEQTENKRIFGSKTQLKKLAHLVSYLSRMESILHKRM